MLEEKVITEGQDEYGSKSVRRSNIVTATLLVITGALYASCGDESGGGRSQCCAYLGCGTSEYSNRHCTNLGSSSEDDTNDYCTTNSQTGDEECCKCEYD